MKIDEQSEPMVHVEQKADGSTVLARHHVHGGTGQARVVVDVDRPPLGPARPEKLVEMGPRREVRPTEVLMEREICIPAAGWCLTTACPAYTPTGCAVSGGARRVLSIRRQPDGELRCKVGN